MECSTAYGPTVIMSALSHASLGVDSPMHRILILLAIASSVVETPAIGQQKLSLKAKLMPLIERHEGDVAVSVKHLKTGERFDHRADDVMPTASLCKLGVMVAAYRRVDSGAVDLNKAIVLKADDMVPGSGVLTQHFSPGTTLSLRDAIRLMIAYSDNTATNLVTDAIGLKTTSEEMTSLGFAETKIHSKVYRRDTSIFPDRSTKYSLGSTTAGETVALLEQLHKKKCASESACDAMIQHLLECDDDSKIASGLPSTIRFAHKTGAVDAIRCDGGLILAEDGPIAICILTRNNKDKRWSPQNAAHRLCRDVGQIVYEHFEPEQPSRSIVLGEPLRTGAFGEIVEMLQRTLNARLRPSPELSIDGDFGPATETAVRRFQESKELPVTGIVNRDTWTALGTLVAPAPQPEPDVVNNAILHKDSPDEIDGPPLTTCRGYAVLDAESGKVVLGVKPDTKFEPASTTKIMTGWLVAKLAEENTDILDEVVVFSQRADLMRGSTSGLRAGERISVREALYGSDASVWQRYVGGSCRTLRISPCSVNQWFS